MSSSYYNFFSFFFFFSIYQPFSYQKKKKKKKKKNKNYDNCFANCNTEYRFTPVQTCPPEPICTVSDLSDCSGFSLSLFLSLSLSFFLSSFSLSLFFFFFFFLSFSVFLSLSLSLSKIINSYRILLCLFTKQPHISKRSHSWCWKRRM